MNKSTFDIIDLPYADPILHEHYPVVGVDAWNDQYYVHKNGGEPKPEALHECDQFDTLPEALSDAVSKWTDREFRMPYTPWEV